MFVGDRTTALTSLADAAAVLYVQSDGVSYGRDDVVGRLASLGWRVVMATGHVTRRDVT